MACQTFQYILRMLGKDGSITGEGSVGPSAHLIETAVRHHISGLWLLAELTYIENHERSRTKILEVLALGIQWLLSHEEMVRRIDRHTHSFSYAVMCFGQIQSLRTELPGPVIEKFSEWQSSLLHSVQEGLYMHRFVNMALCPEAKMFWTLLAYHFLPEAVSMRCETTPDEMALMQQAHEFLEAKTGEQSTHQKTVLSLSGLSRKGTRKAHDRPSPTTACLAFHVAWSCLTHQRGASSLSSTCASDTQSRTMGGLLSTEDDGIKIQYGSQLGSWSLNALATWDSPIL